MATSDPYTDLEPGALGTVTRIDDLGTLTVRWDDGHTLGLIPGLDQHDRRGNTFTFAPDRPVIAAFLPEGDRFAPMITNWPSWEPVWVIRAYVHGEPNQVTWETTFTSDTPAEFIAAFLLDLVRKTPLDTDRDEPAPLHSSTSNGHPYDGCAVHHV